MLPKTPLQDSNFEWDKTAILDAYRQAAEYDDFLFGDHDYSYIWKNTNSNDVY